MTFLVQQTLIYAVPLMIVALAGVFAERSGIINLALEGIMIFGAFIGVLFVRTMQGSEVFAAAKAAGDYATLQGLEIMAMVVAALLGAIFSLLLSFASINLRADQTIGGTALNLMAPPGALLHPYYRQPEYPANGGRRCCQLVHDQKEHARHRQVRRPRQLLRSKFQNQIKKEAARAASFFRFFVLYSI